MEKLLTNLADLIANLSSWLIPIVIILVLFFCVVATIAIIFIAKTFQRLHLFKK